MQIGIFLPTFDAGQTPEFLRTLAEAAEAVGAATLWAPEHVLIPDGYESKYPYSEDGRFPLDPSGGGLADPFVALSFLAGMTRTIRLATGICLVAQRNPVYTAKLVAGLDVLCHGRLDFGVGIGWLKEEFEALNEPFDRRAQRTRAYLEIMRRLWTGEQVSYRDEFYTLPPVHLAPRPVQQPHPPIVIGGESDAALRRVADLGQGWFGWNLTPEETAERLVVLDRLLAKRGRSRRDVSIIVSPYTKPARDLDAMQRYRDLGVDQVVHLLPIAANPDEVRAALEWLGEHIIAPCAAR